MTTETRKNTADQKETCGHADIFLDEEFEVSLYGVKTGKYFKGEAVWNTREVMRMVENQTEQLKDEQTALKIEKAKKGMRSSVIKWKS